MTGTDAPCPWHHRPPQHADPRASSRCRSPSRGRSAMYTCGPTVYRWAHVGNLRSYLLADLIRRVAPVPRVPVLHVKNITDVGHLRDERFDRGEDRMLVAAGLEAEDAGRDRRRLRGRRSTRTRRWSTSCPRTSSRGRPSTSPTCSTWPTQLEDARPCLPVAPGNLYYAVASFADYGRLSGNTLDSLRAGHRGEVEPDKRDPADFALWKAAGEGRILRWPSPWGDGLPGLAPRVLGDGPALPRAGLRDPHRRHRQRLPASRGRDRPVDAGHGRAAGAPLGPRRAPAGVRPEDGEVDRQLRAGHGAARSRHRSARLPLPRADRRATGASSTTRRRRSRPRRRRSARCARTWRRWARRRPTARGRAPPPLRAGSAPARARRASRTVSPGHGRRATATSPDARSTDRATTPALPSRRPAARSTTASSPPSTTTWTCPPRSRSCARRSDADIPADERRWLVLDADLVLGLDLDRVWDGRRRAARRADDLPAERRRCSRRARRPAPHGTGPRPTRCATSSRRLGVEVDRRRRGHDLAPPRAVSLRSLAPASRRSRRVANRLSTR